MAEQARQRRQAAGPARRRSSTTTATNARRRRRRDLPPAARPGGFTYYKDEAKTEANRRGDYFTMGDVGYFDEDDYLFLTGRNAETIISGGVNIYPQEVDNELIKHQAVEDSCTIGAPERRSGARRCGR